MIQICIFLFPSFSFCGVCLISLIRPIDSLRLPSNFINYCIYIYINISLHISLYTSALSILKCNITFGELGVGLSVSFATWCTWLYLNLINVYTLHTTVHIKYLCTPRTSVSTKTICIQFESHNYMLLLSCFFHSSFTQFVIIGTYPVSDFHIFCINFLFWFIIYFCCFSIEKSGRIWDDSKSINEERAYTYIANIIIKFNVSFCSVSIFNGMNVMINQIGMPVI